MSELNRQIPEKVIDQDPAASARAFFDSYKPLESFKNVNSHVHVSEILNRSLGQSHFPPKLGTQLNNDCDHPPLNDDPAIPVGIGGTVGVPSPLASGRKVVASPTMPAPKAAP